ncbi:site-specific integrase [Acidovorax sp. LjRoot66]|uniref:tyrosine-type recombinase/integrase n=1 Tax=Acidovorax sp. LjRoot66 TaxID=3342334 RepID=UPI003ECD03F5
MTNADRRKFSVTHQSGDLGGSTLVGKAIKSSVDDDASQGGVARLDYIEYSKFRASLNQSGAFAWSEVPLKNSVKLPQIFWGVGRGWDEANVWALERTLAGSTNVDTVKRNFKHLLTYARFLEATSEDWRHFPVSKEDQPLRKFRAFLIEQRDCGEIKSSTAANCIGAIIQFYRYVQLKGLIDSSKPLWEDRIAIVNRHDSTGFKRTILRLASELSIPNRSLIGDVLEDGLLPIDCEQMSQLLRYTSENETIDFHYMLSCGFFTGARIGSIVSFTVDSIRNAREDPLAPGLFRIAVGPGTGISTKFSVSGEIFIPSALLIDLQAYARSTHRLLREAKAGANHKNLLFLSRSGKPYSVATVNTVNFECRKSASAAGLKSLSQFTFHQSRATFGTWFMSLLLESGSKTDALRIVRDAMLHRSESTTLGYISFLENSKSKIYAASAFNAAFTGIKIPIKPNEIRE